MINLLLVAPLIIPLTAAAICLLAWRKLLLQRILSVVSAVALLGAGVMLLRQVEIHGICAVQMGGWPAPFGITLVADLFSAIMVALAGLIGLAVAVYSLANIDLPRESFGYHPLLQVLLMGVCGAFLTGDLFNLYVWFEVMLMASFVLLVLGGEGPQLHGGIKYVTLNLVSSAIFLAAVGILYGMAGTLNMADLARKLDGIGPSGAVTTVAMLFLIAFGIKAAVFPFFFWLPASYHTPPVAVSAVFAGLLTKVGVYALVRVFTLLFVQDADYTHTIILILAGCTMVTGVLGAAAQYEFRHILSFHIVSQIGYMIMGLGLAGLTASTDLATAALAGSVFYIIHHIIVKTNLFLVSGVVQRKCGSLELRKLGGLYRSSWGLAILFLIPAASLGGIPPLSGFFAKLSLIQAGLRTEQYPIVAVALAVGLLTLFSMTKIWSEAFWKPMPAAIAEQLAITPPTPTERNLLLIPIGALAALTVTIGLAARPFFDLASRAAEQLVNRQAYIEAVLGATP